MLTWLVWLLAGNGAAPDVDVHLQVRPRGEKSSQGNLQAVPANGDQRLSQRTRGILSVEGAELGARVSVQDVRIWASELSTTDFSAEGLDMHEAWAQYGEATFLRVGRQELAFDEERLVGPLNWFQQARSFDGARLTWTAAEKQTLTLFAARVREGQLRDVGMAHVAVELGGLRVAAPLIWEDNRWVARRERGSDPDAWYRSTAGLHVSSLGGSPLAWRLEAYAQNGEDSQAFMVGGRLGYSFAPYLAPLLWVDYLSGDEDHSDGTLGTFDTLFATNHGYYGLIDIIASIPRDTANGGLIDFAVKNSSQLWAGKLFLEGHYFRLAEIDDLGREGSLGWEVDAVFRYPLAEELGLELGAALFGWLADYAEGREVDMHDWYYLQLDMQI